MNVSKLLIAIALALAIGVTALLYFRPMESSVLLVAKEAVPVFATAEASMALPLPQTVAELTVNQSVAVMQCIDVKHYQIYKVQLRNGKAGYVNRGKYVLLGKDGKPTSC